MNRSYRRSVNIEGSDLNHNLVIVRKVTKHQINILEKQVWLLKTLYYKVKERFLDIK